MKENGGLRSGRDGRRLETQKQQREAKVKLHPRGLARSIADKHGWKQDWRERVAELPRTGKDRIRPKKQREDSQVTVK